MRSLITRLKGDITVWPKSEETVWWGHPPPQKLEAQHLTYRQQTVKFHRLCLFCNSLCIVNDQLFIRMATTEEIRRAFVAPAPTPSSSPVPTLTAPQQEMLTAFSQKSRMNLEWSQKWVFSLWVWENVVSAIICDEFWFKITDIWHRCLQDNEWDFNRAAQVFTQLKVKRVIQFSASRLMSNHLGARP